MKYLKLPIDELIVAIQILLLKSSIFKNITLETICSDNVNQLIFSFRFAHLNINFIRKIFL